MALYPPAVKKLIPPGPNDPKIIPRVIALHVAASEAGSLYNWFNGPSNGVESHFYVTRTGGVEQYRDTDWQADANLAANDFAISIETQGLEYGQWTPEQLAALFRLFAWLNATHPTIPLKPCTRWDGAGIGYHSQFVEWAPDGRTCPGPDRKAQIRDVIWPALTGTAPTTETGALTMSDVQTILDTIARLSTQEAGRYSDIAGRLSTLATQEAGRYSDLAGRIVTSTDPAQIALALEPAVTEAVNAALDGEAATADEVAAAVVEKLAAALAAPAEVTA